MMAVGAELAVLASSLVAPGAGLRRVFDALEASGKVLLDLSPEQVNAFAGNVLLSEGAAGPVVAISRRALKPFTRPTSTAGAARAAGRLCRRDHRTSRRRRHPLHAGRTVPALRLIQRSKRRDNTIEVVVDFTPGEARTSSSAVSSASVDSALNIGDQVIRAADGEQRRHSRHRAQFSFHGLLLRRFNRNHRVRLYLAHTRSGAQLHPIAADHTGPLQALDPTLDRRASKAEATAELSMSTSLRRPVTARAALHPALESS
jgi:hypothetical protein